MSEQKNLFGFEVNCKDDLTLALPDMATFTKLHSELNFKNKDFFWTAIRPIISFISEFRVVIWVGNPDFVDKAENVTQILRDKKANTFKEVMMDFYCFFYGCDSNILAFAASLINKKSMRLATMIVDKGACSLPAIADYMEWPKYKPSQWGSQMDKDTYERWQNSSNTSLLSLMSFILSGPAPEFKGERSYNCPIYPYVMPDYRMINFITSHLASSLEITDPDDPDLNRLIYFSGEDLFGNEETLQNLIVSGVITPGKLKLGLNTVKKLNTLMILKQFPDIARSVMSRTEYLLNAAFLVFGEPTDMEFPENKLPDSRFLKTMYENIKINCRYYLSNILSTSVKGVVQEFFYLNRNSLKLLFQCVAATLQEGLTIREKGWISFELFSLRVNYMLSANQCGYIYPDTYSVKPESIKDIDGEPLTVSEFKSHFHDIILRAMIEGFASIGGVDFLYDREGNLCFLRLSRAGQWYLGIIDQMPKVKAATNSKEYLEIDDRTGLILIKKPNYPYLNLLPDFADKMTETRYYINEKAFLRNCENPDMLGTKIKRFRMFILPKPGPRITAMIENLTHNCNVVHKSPEANSYQLLDVAPSNTRLHNLIVDHLEIRDNSLRVEGCRLLVKTKFLPRFFDILSQHGFLNNVTI